MKKIQEAIEALPDNLKKEHDKCLAEGYKDELCPGCGAVFLAHHHFVRCSSEKPCPMSNGKSLLQMWMEAIAEDPTQPF